MRLKLSHRLNLLKGLIKRVRPDGRIEAQANSCHANTARMAHRIVVNIPKADPKVLLGKELRSLFIVPEGRVLIGCDASGLEARMLAHYLDDEIFTNEILTSDIHTVIQGYAKLETRSQAKTLLYAIMYGAGDAKLGTIVNGGSAEGKSIRSRLYEKLPKLAHLDKKVKLCAKKNNYVPALDGRRLMIRSTHSALNVLLQGAGAIVMKLAMILFNKKLEEHNLDAFQVGVFHDEFQVESSEKDAEEVAHWAKWSITQAGIELKMKCPLDAESKIGKNWADTH
jgi:DNA polymerase-1